MPVRAVVQADEVVRWQWRTQTLKSSVDEVVVLKMKQQVWTCQLPRLKSHSVYSLLLLSLMQMQLPRLEKRF